MSTIYVCKQTPALRFRLGDNRYQFNNGELRLSNEKDIKQLDELIKTKMPFSATVSKVDKEAAEVFARQHMKDTQFKLGASKGGIDSETIRHSQTPIEQRDAELSDISPGQLDHIKEELQNDSNLIITDKVENPIVSTTTPVKPANALSNLTEKRK